jgi:Ran GTPase-activating protein (RanGAP) involved in mRNA processing and transport
LVPFFEFLKSNQPPFKPNTNVAENDSTSHDVNSFSTPKADIKYGHEPYYSVNMVEFNKGVLYTDRRMDLCKMVVGPNHINELMQSLVGNDHVKHFLLGNNIIGPTGARAISDFIKQYPDHMETWYLAGNMIDATSFATIVDALAGTNIQALWLKRNPLGKTSIDSIFKVITKCPKLRVLDLDQTELSNAGVAEVFNRLASFAIDSGIALETIYMNGNGLSLKACEAISRFLQSPGCRLENLYMSGNPVGARGAVALGSGIEKNRTLKRFSLTSCGLNSAGGLAIAESLATHPSIIALDIGQSIATEDLGFRYNYIEDDAIDAFGRLLMQSTTLRYLNVGTTGITLDGVRQLREYVLQSALFSFQAKSCFHREPYSDAMQTRLRENVQRELGMSVDQFIAGPLRFIRSPEDVRHIDSVYRNRDAQLARQHLKVLKKAWDSDDSTMEDVLRFEDKAAEGAVGPFCTKRRS